MKDTINRQRYWENYLSKRTSTYEMRCQRFEAVAKKLIEYNLSSNDLLVDIGAGSTEFDYFLRTEYKWRGRYLPIDGCLDGIELNTYYPTTPADFYVAIELLEHLKSPGPLTRQMQVWAKNACVATTPNPDTVDVLKMDPTHVLEIPVDTFKSWGWKTEINSFFGNNDDSILAWCEGEYIV